jgi:hypothetical protein
MKQETLTKLIEHKAYPCVAIFIPTHPLIPDRYTDAHRIKEIFEKLKFALVEANAHRNFNLTEMLIKAEDVLHSIDFNHQQNGIGIYLSPTISETISFPFIPRERIVINEHFPLREIYYLRQMRPSYHLLNLHRDAVHLFEGNGSELNEIFNSHFPMELEESYEYARNVNFRSNGSVMTGQFEKEKSTIKEKRTAQFYRNADKLLSAIKTPIILSGEDERIHSFLEITKNRNAIKGTIAENLHPNETEKMGRSASLLLSAQRKNNDLVIRRELDELYGEEMAVFGITNCWKYAHEGDGLILYLEYDLFESAYLSNDGSRIKKRLLFRNVNFTRVPDIVERIISEVVNKGGKVVFANYGTLKNYDGIALKLRYPA